MGLDVYLCQFKDLDTGAVLKLSRCAEEPWAFEKGAGPKLEAKARELHLPEDLIKRGYLGGEPISFPSKKHPELPVGEWYSFSTARELMEHFTGKDIYFVFPEAKGNPGFLRPDWASSRRRLIAILKKLQKLKPEQIEDFDSRFVLAQIHPDFLVKMERVGIRTASESFAGYLAQIEVMIETLDHVLNHERPREFLLRWSA